MSQRFNFSNQPTEQADENLEKMVYSTNSRDILLQKQAMNLAQLNERIRLYFKTGSKNLDEFDEILTQLQMNIMQNDGQMGQIEHLSEIKQHFKRRAERYEFPAICYLVYLN